jgi:hypothetical protein
VRRSFNGSYPPLYQIAYMIGGLQFRALHLNLPLISDTCRTMFGEDLLAPVPGLRDYLGAFRQRPHAQRVHSERKAGVEAFVAYRAKVQAGASGARAG